MKGSILSGLIIAFLVLLSCNKLDIEKGTPKCVENKVRDFAKGQSCNTANVRKFTFQGKTVYVFDPGNCGADMSAEVIDPDCNNLGSLGGLICNTIINGEDFSNATFESIIWEN